jgi:4-diphosphocytidyl-2-C-methyl-D-erythritol kinase
MVNPRIAVATKDVFAALGLGKGELLAGTANILAAPAWPGAEASITDWVKALKASGNDLEAPALKVEPVIGDVLTALRDAPGALLARMSGSGATCFAIFGADSDALAAGKSIHAAHPNWWVHAGALS